MKLRKILALILSVTLVCNFNKKVKSSDLVPANPASSGANSISTLGGIITICGLAVNGVKIVFDGAGKLKRI